MLIGLIANPYSSKDVRRLVGLARVIDAEEKANMIARLLAGLAAGPPLAVAALDDGAGLVRRGIRLAARAVPPIRFLDLVAEGGEVDTRRAAVALAEERAFALITVGGDGTVRAAVEGWPRARLVPVAAGTNNAIALTDEPTVIGLTTARLTNAANASDAFRDHSRLVVETGSDVATAVVDVVATSNRWTGARAMWEPADLLEAVVAFAPPTAVGIASVAAALGPLAAGTARHIRFGPGREVQAVLAPGLVAHVEVAGFRDLPLDSKVVLGPSDGVVALDGERRVSSSATSVVSVVPGPSVLDLPVALRITRPM